MWFPARAKWAGPWLLRRGLWLCALHLAACTALVPEVPVLHALPEAIPAIQLRPLSTAEFDAALLESKRRNRHQREDAINQPWDSLKPDQLRRMLHMPAFAALSDRSKEPLIDQAGAWNLLTFERPSEALALWAMLFPDRKIEQPIDPKVGTRLPHLHVYRADEPWAIESAATMVMMGCLSPPVWHVYTEDPMLWAMRSNTGWEVPNSFDFGMCVRKSTPATGPGLWSIHTDTAYGRRISAVLEDKFSRLLLRQGCTGKGPDSCLHLMYALASLNPSHPQWPAILDKTASAFVPENLPPIGTTDRATLIAARTALARQNIYLGIRLQVLGHSAAAWPQDGTNAIDGMGQLRATIARHCPSSGLHSTTHAAKPPPSPHCALTCAPARSCKTPGSAPTGPTSPARRRKTRASCAAHSDHETPTPDSHRHCKGLLCEVIDTVPLSETLETLEQWCCTAHSMASAACGCSRRRCLWSRWTLTASGSCGLCLVGQPMHRRHLPHSQSHPLCAPCPIHAFQGLLALKRLLGKR